MVWVKTMLPVESRIPPLFRFVQHRIATDGRGGYRLARILEGLHSRFGVLDRCAPFPLPNGGNIVMPLYWPMLLHKDRLLNYEAHQIEAFSRALDDLGGNVTLVDCGADVGLFTCLVLRKSHSVKVVHAFEPNSRSFFVLEKNLSALNIEAHAHCAAVSNCEGMAHLREPEQCDEQYLDHSKFIELGGGSVPVTSVDRLGLPHHCPVAIKIDVEGEEFNVIEGARATLSAVPNFVIQVEAHADVAMRTNTDPCELVKAVSAIRDISVKVIHDKRGVIGDRLALDRPFFDQYPVKSCDILMVPRGAF